MPRLNTSGVHRPWQFYATAIIVLACFLATGTAFAASGNSSSSNAGKLITIITPSYNNEFYKAEADSAAAEAKKLGYQTNSVVHNGDPNRQLQLIQTAISNNSAAIILDNAGANASIAAVRQAEKAGVPVFLIDREINANGVAQAQIVSNNSQCATSAGEFFAQKLNYQGKYAELLGKPTDTNAKVRSDGFHRVLNRMPKLKMVAQQTADWQQAKAYNVTQSIIQAHPDINGIISGNDTMALGAAAALKNAGMNHVVVVSIDGNPAVVNQIAHGGIIKATALQQAIKMAKMAVSEANKYIHTGSTGKPEKQLVNCVLITKKNADKVRQGGFGMK